MRKQVLEVICAGALLGVTAFGAGSAWQRHMLHERMMHALDIRDAAVVARCIRQGESVDQANADGWTPLMVAASHADTKLVREFIQRGAAVNARNRSYNTAFEVAITIPKVATLDALADAGVDSFKTGPRAGTAMFLAAWYGNDRNVTWLVQHGASPELGASGFTPLMHAVYCGHSKAVAALLAAGADPNATDGHVTPLYMAEQRRMTEIARLLKQHGGRSVCH